MLAAIESRFQGMHMGSDDHVRAVTLWRYPMQK